MSDKYPHCCGVEMCPVGDEVMCRRCGAKDSKKDEPMRDEPIRCGLCNEPATDDGWGHHVCSNEHCPLGLVELEASQHTAIRSALTAAFNAGRQREQNIYDGAEPEPEDFPAWYSYEEWLEYKKVNNS